ncbi:unnamed protein product [Amoebophrya sp. A120]|nr:unnamed protein product [Amoebophrya sp. A120]|eukprot:GSA120T00006885001.1
MVLSASYFPTRRSSRPSARKIDSAELFVGLLFARMLSYLVLPLLAAHVDPGFHARSPELSSSSVIFVHGATQTPQAVWASKSESGHPNRKVTVSPEKRSVSPKYYWSRTPSPPTGEGLVPVQCSGYGSSTSFGQTETPCLDAAAAASLLEVPAQSPPNRQPPAPSRSSSPREQAAIPPTRIRDENAPKRRGGRMCGAGGKRLPRNKVRDAIANGTLSLGNAQRRAQENLEKYGPKVPKNTRATAAPPERNHREQGREAHDQHHSDASEPAPRFAMPRAEEHGFVPSGAAEARDDVQIGLDVRSDRTTTGQEREQHGEQSGQASGLASGSAMLPPAGARGFLSGGAAAEDLYFQGDAAQGGREVGEVDQTGYETPRRGGAGPPGGHECSPWRFFPNTPDQCWGIHKDWKAHQYQPTNPLLEATPDRTDYDGVTMHRQTAPPGVSSQDCPFAQVPTWNLDLPCPPALSPPPPPLRQHHASNFACPAAVPVRPVDDDQQYNNYARAGEQDELARRAGATTESHCAQRETEIRTLAAEMQKSSAVGAAARPAHQVACSPPTVTSPPTGSDAMPTVHGGTARRNWQEAHVEPRRVRVDHVSPTRVEESSATARPPGRSAEDHRPFAVRGPPPGAPSTRTRRGEAARPPTSSSKQEGEIMCGPGGVPFSRGVIKQIKTGILSLEEAQRQAFLKTEPTTVLGEQPKKRSSRTLKPHQNSGSSTARPPAAYAVPPTEERAVGRLSPPFQGAASSSKNSSAGDCTQQ